MPTNGHPQPNGPNGHPAPAAPSTAARIALSSRAWMWGLIAIVAGGLLWFGYSSIFDRRRSFDDVYADKSAPPATGTVGSQLQTASMNALKRPVMLKKLKNGIKISAVGEAPVLSRHTLVVRSAIAGREVVMFVDKLDNDTADAARRAARMGGECCHAEEPAPAPASAASSPPKPTLAAGGGMQLFRRVGLGDVVVYELTPFDKPVLSDQLFIPPADACHIDEELEP
jgi:hypothetical protein